MHRLGLPHGRLGSVSELPSDTSTPTCRLTRHASRCTVHASFDRTIYVADMSNNFHSMTLRGRKNFSIQMPCPIQDIEVLPLRRHRVPHVVLVGLHNGHVHMYNEKWLVGTLTVDGPVRALRAGYYGREENALVRRTAFCAARFHERTHS